MRTLIRAALWRATFPLVELPVYFYCLVGACIGRLDRAACLHGRVVQRVTGASLRGPTSGRLLVTSVLALPMNAGLFAVALYVWSLIPVNLGYPLRPDTTPESLRTSWGGPSLAGAWAVHVVGATATFLLLGLPLLCALAWMQVRVLRLLMDTRPPRPVPTDESRRPKGSARA